MVNKLKIEDDIQGDYGTPIPTMIDVLEGVVVRGLSFNRELNGEPTDYKIWDDMDDMVS